MDRPGQFVGQNLMHGAMPVDSAFAFKGRRHNIDTEMRFTLRSRPGMAGMKVGFIDNLEALRLKCLRQSFFNTIFKTHLIKLFVCVVPTS